MPSGRGGSSPLPRTIRDNLWTAQSKTRTAAQPSRFSVDCVAFRKGTRSGTPVEDSKWVLDVDTIGLFGTLDVDVPLVMFK